MTEFETRLGPTFLRSLLWGGCFIFLYLLILRIIFQKLLQALLEHFPGRPLFERLLFFRRQEQA